MAEGFTKLFSTLTTSTIWSEPLATRVVWITMLAVADRNGEVQAAIPGLARLANVSVQECETALQTFLSPDPYSRTTDNEGRRIEVIDGGWRLLNHAKYRAKMAAEERREYKREWMARDREERKQSQQSTECPQESTESTIGQSGHKQKQRQKQEDQEQESSLRSDSPDSASPESEKLSKESKIVDSIVEIFNAFADRCRKSGNTPGVKKTHVMTPKLRKKLLEANKRAYGLIKRRGWTMGTGKFWEAYFAYCERAGGWLAGKEANPDNPSWKQHLVLLVDDDRFRQVMDAAIDSMEQANMEGAGA